MGDVIQPSAEAYHAVYAASFRMWSRLRRQAKAESSLPLSALSLSDAFLQYPHFPPNVKVEYARYRRYSRAYVKGSSEWGSPLAGCRHEMPPFHQPVDITVTTKKPTHLSIQGDPEDNYMSSWIPSQDRNHVSILTLAWSYVLSARWAELLAGECSITYTDAQALGVDRVRAQSDQKSILEVYLGDHSPEEARWWAAVLASGRGWHATMMMDGDELLAPWSASLEQSPIFALSGQPDPSSSLPTQHLAASSTQAFRFLDKFCQLHRIEEQGLAALTAALLLPSLHGTRSLTLPTPRLSPQKHGSKLTSTSSPATGPAHRQLQHLIQHQHLDRLLTLSCHTRSIDCILLGVFFNPGIECGPSVAGLQEKLVRQVGFGQIPTDLNAAAWSGTIQSFVQMPVSDPSQRSDFVSRADECRLLFLSQTDSHSRAPVCQWAPFGETSIDEADVEVRLHKDCKGHMLQYKGFIWDSGCTQREMSVLIDVNFDSKSDAIVESNGQEYDLPTPEVLDHSKEFISEVATRSIFNWLRPDGCTSRERKLWKHEWLDLPQSDEDEEAEDGESGKKSCSRVRSWIKGLKEDPYPAI